ncbi:MBL fold metallo-hydrolase [Candidatus Auribacterota bacterium]
MLSLKKLRLITLSENTAKWLWVLGEWGWSMLIEADGLRLLFDTGLRMAAKNNAAVMGEDLKKIDKILLSHGHLDHTGGLRDILLLAGTETGKTNIIDRNERNMEIICHPDVWGPKYVKHPGDKEYSFAGIPFCRAELEQRGGARFTESKKPVWITDDMVWSGEIPMINDYERITPICFIKNKADAGPGDDSAFGPDPVTDDAALYIKTDQGLVIILGCGHHGIINTIHHAQKVTGMEEIHTVAGGTHLVDATENQLEKVIAELKRLKVKKLGVSHCTGAAPSAKLSDALGTDVFFYNNSGNVISY